MLVVGIVLIAYGYDQVNSIGSKISKAMGESDILGYASIAVGVVLSFLGIKSIIR